MNKDSPWLSLPPSRFQIFLIVNNNQHNTFQIISSHILHPHLAKDITNKIAFSSTPTAAPIYPSATKSLMFQSNPFNETSPLLSGKVPSRSEKIPMSPSSDKTPASPFSDQKPTNSLSIEKSQYQPPSETHPAFATITDVSSDSPPAYATHEELFDTENSQAKEKGQMWKEFSKPDAGKQGSGGYFVGVGGAGNYKRN